MLATEENNGWSQIKVHVVDVSSHYSIDDLSNELFLSCFTIYKILKPGGVGLKAGKANITLWLPEVCQLTIDFQVGDDYHIQGLDGLKFVLDHNSHIERWPERTLNECKEKEKKDCFQKECKKSKNSKQRKECEKKKSNKNKCKKEADKKCKKVKNFYDYVKDLKDGQSCELENICE